MALLKPAAASSASLHGCTAWYRKRRGPADVYYAENNAPRPKTRRHRPNSIDAGDAPQTMSSGRRTTRLCSHAQNVSRLPRLSLCHNTSAHFLWIGDHTRQLTGAHVEFPQAAILTRTEVLEGVTICVNCRHMESARPPQKRSAGEYHKDFHEAATSAPKATEEEAEAETSSSLKHKPTTDTELTFPTAI
ncbi:hypothetical protein C8J57DRAFT_1250977 [Mycena rebaudengoi]|nr:hypothetical protein C8J57DRAFT_1250977 [Mycena rebaudengoi]